MQIRQLGYGQVPQFSKRDIDYSLNSEFFREFINYPFEYDQFRSVIDNRKVFKTNRELLSRIAKKQYQGMDSSNRTLELLDQLEKDNCYTVCTAHQPSLMTGPLYYCFKILSTIKLAQRLSQDFSHEYIVPVFIIGAEDHDFEEINHFHLFGKRLEWSNEAKGATGRFNTDGLELVINEMYEILGPDSKIGDLKESLMDFSKNSENYAEFSFKLTHLLFDHLGLLILRTDEKGFKSEFKAMMQEEIFDQVSQNYVEETQNAIESMSYTKQAHAREINFFYHCDQGRKRIIKDDDKFRIIDTQIEFTRKELEQELNERPENFSPNVVMRPIFQEHILPNLAYVGGGGELAYWLERKSQFEHFNVHFPMLVRRNSAMICTESTLRQVEKTGFDLVDYFKTETELIKAYIESSDNEDFHLDQYVSELEQLFADIESKVNRIDPSLISTTRSELAKAKKSLGHLEGKLSKSIKRKEEVNLNRIKKLRSRLFPGGLQERHDSILEFLSSHGINLLDKLLDHMDPFEKELKIFILPKQER